MRTQKTTTKRRLSATVETERVLVIRSRDRALDGWCKHCGRRVMIVILHPAEAVARDASSTAEFTEPGSLLAHRLPESS